MDVSSHKIDYLIQKIDNLQMQIEFLKSSKKELFYQKIVEKYLDGKHMSLPSGITDVTNNDVHAEIKNWDTWKVAISQLLCYNDDLPREKLQAYMFGKTPNQEKTKCIYEKFQKYNIDLFVFEIQQNVVYIKQYSTNKIMYSYFEN